MTDLPYFHIKRHKKAKLVFHIRNESVAKSYLPGPNPWLGEGSKPRLVTGTLGFSVSCAI